MSEKSVFKTLKEGLIRLLPGLGLIIAASLLLLLTDLQHRSRSSAEQQEIAIFQMASRPVMEDSVAGAIQGLKEQGFEPGRNIRIRFYNAENDLPTANAMARSILESGNSLVMTFSSPILQVMANANRDGRMRHIFGAVTDPFAAGVGITKNSHPAYLTGIGTFQPVRDTFRLGKKMLPTLATVGTVWHPGDAAAEACIIEARDEAARLGIKLVEAQVDNSSAVAEAASSLTAKGVQAIWIGGDNTVELAMESVVKVAKQAGIPVMTNAPSHLKNGAFLSLGADYREVGRLVGILAGKVLKGQKISGFPVENVVPQQLALNLAALKGVREHWQVDAATRANAAILMDEDGRMVKSIAPSAPAGVPSGKRWKIQLLDYADAVNAEETHQGLFAELKLLGLQEGREYQMLQRSAHGDMAVLNSIIDSAVTEQPDLVITTATPALQAAVAKIRKIPVVFTTVADGVIAGAGKSPDNHIPNITGVTTMSDFDGMVKVVQECIPGVKKIGTLYTPSEINSVLYRDGLVKAASARGVQVDSVAVTTSADVADAALALTGRGVQAITQISDNTTGNAVGVIASAAEKARVPLFAFVSIAVKDGAAIAVARDYRESGELAARIVLRIMRGEDPAGIPFTPIKRSSVTISRKNSARYGIQIPKTLLDRADKVVD